MRRTLCVAMVLAMLAVMPNSFAFAAGFLKYEGIDGESKDKDHEKWIDVLSWKWEKAKSKQVGRGGCGRFEQTDLVITKALDSASPEFLRLVESCAREPEVILDVEIGPGPDGDPSTRRIMRIRMMDVLVSKVALGTGKNDDRPTENVSFNFSEVKVEVIVLDREG